MSDPVCEEAGSTSFTFENDSVFTLTLNSATPSGSYAAALPPGSQQIVDVPVGGGGVNLNYQLNAPSTNNFNLNLQNQNGTVQYSATQVPGMTQTPVANGLTLSGGAPALTVQQYATIPFRGVNLSGAEEGDT